MKISKIRFVVVLLFVNATILFGQEIDFTTEAERSIDSRIISNTTKPLYSVRNISGPARTHSFERNTACWAADIDLTCASAWTSSASDQSTQKYLRTATLITPRHAIMAAHFLLRVGDTIQFVTQDNQIVTRTVKARGFAVNFSYTYPDIYVVLLDSDVPSTITPCKFLPANYGSYIFYKGKGVPVLYTDQERKALVGEIDNLNVSSTINGNVLPNMFWSQLSVKAIRKSLFETIVGGDSGSPVFLILNNKPIIVTCITWSNFTGTSYTYFANLPDGGFNATSTNGAPAQFTININGLIKEADAAGGVSTGYKISFFDFLAAGISPVTISSNRVYTSGLTLNVDLKTDMKTEIQIADASGRLINKQQISSQKYHVALPSSGLYFVRITNSKGVTSHKVLAR